MDHIIPSIVKTKHELLNLVDKLNNEEEIFIDCEGKNLCRYGELYIIQIYCKSFINKVYLIDVCSLQNDLFMLNSDNNINLKYIFENKTLYFFDPRCDIDILFNRYNIMPRNVICLQLSEAAYRKKILYLKVNYVSGLSKCIDKYCRITEKEKEVKDKIKTLLKLGKMDYDDFKLNLKNETDDIVIYCCLDVINLPTLKEKLYDKLQVKWKKWVIDNSIKRCKESEMYISLVELKSRERARIPPF